MVGGGDAAHFQLTVVACGLRALTSVGYFDSFVWDVGTILRSVAGNQEWSYRFY